MKTEGLPHRAALFVDLKVVESATSAGYHIATVEGVIMRAIARAMVAVAALFFVSNAEAAAPLEAFARLPAMSALEISEDGSAVAYVRVQEGRQIIVVQQLTGEVLQQVSFGDAKVRYLAWAGPDYVVVVTSVTAIVHGVLNEGEQYQATALNVRNGRTAQLMRRVRERQRYLNVLAGDPVPGVWEGQPVVFVEALAAAEGSSSFRVDLMRVDLDDGDGHLHQIGGPNTTNFLITREGEVIAQTTYDSVTTRWVLSLRRGNSWQDVHTMDARVDIPRLGALTTDRAGVHVAIRDNEEAEWRWVAFSRASGAMNDTSLPSRAALIYDVNSSHMAHVVAEHFSEYTFVAPAHQATWSRILSALPNRQVTLVSSTPDFGKVVVYVEGTGFAGNYLLFDAVSQSLTQVGRAYPDIPASEIAEVRAIRYRAQDGLEIPAYLTLPPGRSPTNLPLVMLPHGGPQSRDYAGFDWMAQALASRGYAVLQPNFRGSSGYGAAFIDAAYGEWGRKMQTDLSDGITYLANRGIVDPSRACIMGASYGGYAALAGVTLQSGIYRCAVAIAGVSDVAELLRGEARQGGRRTSSYRYWTRYLGVESIDDPRLESVSTVRAAGNGEAPVLLIHGRDDTVVPFSQSTAMQRALSSYGRNVRLVELESEDHYLSREATRIQAMQAAVQFLEQHNPPSQ